MDFSLFIKDEEYQKLMVASVIMNMDYGTVDQKQSNSLDIFYTNFL